MLGTLLLSLTAIGVLFLGYQNLENVIQWEVLSELGEFPFVLESTASQKLLAKGYFVTEQFVASPMKINHLAAYFYIFLWCVSWSMVFAAITYWSRWAYLGAMAVTLAVLISLQLDFFLHQLGHIYTGVGLFLYLGISYSFHLFGSRFSFVQIFLSFLFFLLFIYLGVGWMSQQAFNALAVHWAGYSVGISLVVCLVFSFWVSYDIILWILRASLHNLGHFTFFSLVLLGNILLVFLKDMNLIDWPILYLNPFLLLTISGILNLDNWRRLGNAFPAAIRNEFSYFIILGLFLLSMATIGWGYASANDPLLEALEDGVMYTHLIMGICFFLYIIVNFLPLLQHQKEVFRVIYKPLKMPLGVFRVLSLLIMMSILVLRNFFPLYQGLAGYTAGLADVAAFRDDFVFAQSQYQQALLYEGRHHKANYAMASLALWQGFAESTLGVCSGRA
jgi:hypothetical protein